MYKHIPNAITVLRMLTVLPILILFHWSQKSAAVHLVIVFLTIGACLTDFLDGWLARKWNCISDFGKTWDPLADKWLVVLYLPLVSIGLISFIPISILWIRDITITQLRGQRHKVFPAKWSGKMKTAITFPLMCLLIAAVPVKDSYFSFFIPLGITLGYFGGWLVGIVSVWSGIDYYLAMRKN